MFMKLEQNFHFCLLLLLIRCFWLILSLLFFTSDGKWENNRCGRYLKGGQITLEDENDSEF